MYLVREITAVGMGERVVVKLEGESEQALISVTPEVILRLGIKKGDEISEEVYGELSETAELEGAVRKGLSILGYGTNSVSRLEEKLRRNGFSADISSKAAEELVLRGYIDEESDALRFCDAMILKKYGPRKILIGLRNRGYKRSIIQKAEEFLGDIDFSEICESLIRTKIKKIPENREDAKKLVAKLTNLGYNVGDIKRALDRI